MCIGIGKRLKCRDIKISSGRLGGIKGALVQPFSSAYKLRKSVTGVSDKQREIYLSAVASITQINFDRFYAIEGFILTLQAAFKKTEDREKLLRVVGNLKDENVRNYGDFV